MNIRGKTKEMLEHVVMCLSVKQTDCYDQAVNDLSFNLSLRLSRQHANKRTFFFKRALPLLSYYLPTELFDLVSWSTGVKMHLLIKPKACL